MRSPTASVLLALALAACGREPERPAPPVVSIAGATSAPAARPALRSVFPALSPKDVRITERRVRYTANGGTCFVELLYPAVTPP